MCAVPPSHRSVIILLLVASQLLPARKLFAQGLVTPNEAKANDQQGKVDAGTQQYLAEKAKALANINSIKDKNAAEALRLAMIVLDADEKTFGTDSEYRVVTLNLLADLLWMTDQLEQSLNCKREIARVYGLKYGEDDYRHREARWIAQQWSLYIKSRDVVEGQAKADQLVDAARKAHAAGRYQEALRFAQQADQVVCGLYEPDQVPPRAYALTWIGECHAQLRNPAAAEKAYTEAADIYRGWYGTGHVRYADTMLALVPYSPNAAVKERRLREAIEIYERVPNFDRNRLVVTLIDLAQLCVDMKAYAKGLEAAQRARELEQATNGPSSALLRFIDLTTGRLHIGLRNFSEAEKLISLAAKFYDAAAVQQFAAERVQVHRVLATLHRAQKQNDRAITEGQKALEMERRAFGDTRLDQITLLLELAWSQSMAKQFEAGIASAEQAQALADKIDLKRTNAKSIAGWRAEMLRGQAVALNATGKYADAQASLKRGLEIAAPVLGEGDSQVAMLRAQLADQEHIAKLPEDERQELQRVFQLRQQARDATEAGQYAEAEKYSREVIELCKSLGDSQQPYMRGVDYYLLGVALRSQEKVSESEAPLQQAVADFARYFATSAPDDYFATALHHLADALKARGANAEAAERFQSAKSIYEKLRGPHDAATLEAFYQMATCYAAARHFARAEPAWREYIEVVATVDGRQSLEFAFALLGLGSLEFQQGNFSRARELGAQAFEVATGINGVAPLNVDRIQWFLADCDFALRRYDECIANFEQLVERGRANSYADLPAYLRRLAETYLEKQDLARAEQFAAESLAICDSTYGESDGRSRRVTNVLGNIWLKQIQELQIEKKFSEAVAVREEYLAAYRKHFGDEFHAEPVEAQLAIDKQVASLPTDAQQAFAEAERLTRDAKKLFDSDQQTAGIAAARRAADLYQQSLGAQSLKVASALLFSARHMPAGDAALEAIRKAIAIRQAAGGDDSLEVGNARFDYADKLFSGLRVGEALVELERAMQIYEHHRALLSDRDRAVVKLLLADLKLSSGDTATVQELIPECARALDPVTDFHEWNRLLGVQCKLASLMQDHVERLRLAQQLYDRTIQRYGPDSYRGADAAVDLASELTDSERFDEATQLLERAKQSFKSQGLGDAAEYGNCLNYTAKVFLDQHKYSDAIPHLEKASTLFKNLGDDGYAGLQATLRLLSEAYSHTGKLAEAEEAARRSLAIQEKLAGENGQLALAYVSPLVRVLYAQKKFAEMVPVTEDTLIRYEKLMQGAADYQTESQQAAAMTEARDLLGWYLFAAAQQPELADKCYDHVLLLKGVTFARQRRLRELRDNPEAATLLAEWGRTTGSLATLALRLPYADQQAAWSQRVATLTLEKDRLERKLMALSRHSEKPVATAVQLRKALPANSVLVDFYSYRAFDRELDESTEVPQLRAFILRPDSPQAVLVKIEARELEATIDRWREALDIRNSEAVQEALANQDEELANKLYREALETQQEMAAKIKQLVWTPLEKHLEGKELVIVSPDGPLAKFPFAAIPGQEPNTYLIEKVAITTLAVPSMLPEMMARKPDVAEPESLLLIGDVDYGGSAGLADVRAAQLAADARSWLPFQFSELIGVRPEMDDIKATFAKQYADGKSLVFARSEANEGAFRREAPKHRWVHLATHGFYATDISEVAQSRVAKSGDADDSPVHPNAPGIEHDGLKSGLALAGANEFNAENEDDGILCSMEVSSMDLYGVELAVLSACETGLGQSVSGEGVAGLQRAFQVAGARSTVTSLWPVSDIAARLLTARFYRNLWGRKMSKADAIREAQQWMIAAAWKDDGEEEIDPEKLTIDSEVLPRTFRLPEYWAPFVLSGDWR